MNRHNDHRASNYHPKRLVITCVQIYPVHELSQYSNQKQKVERKPAAPETGRNG